MVYLFMQVGDGFLEDKCSVQAAVLWAETTLQGMYFGGDSIGSKSGKHDVLQ